MMQPLGVQVTIVEMLPVNSAQHGWANCRTATRIFKHGVQSHVADEDQSLALTGQTAQAKLSNGTTLEADRVLVATGRRPNTAEVGLSSVGLTADRGFVRVNDRMETAVKDYYCIGDANGRCLLAHAASRTAWLPWKTPWDTQALPMPRFPMPYTLSRKSLGGNDRR